MATSTRRIRDLVEEDPGLMSALEVVFERTDGGKSEVEWAAVREDLSSGQWGRLIETGILVDGEEGFELADPDAVSEVVADDETVAAAERAAIEADDGDGGGWTTWDKAAAVGAIGMFAGYSIGSVRDVIGNTINVLLGPLDALLPFYVVILLLATLTGLYSTLLQANLMDMEKMSVYQTRMKDIQERQKAAKERGDDEAVEEIREEQMEAMGDQLGMFKLQFRPMVWIMLLTIPVFLWMYWKILPGGGGIADPEGLTVVMPFIGELTDGWTQGVLGPIQAWIVWYFLCSMAITQIIRKALNIQTTPT